MHRPAVAVGGAVVLVLLGLVEAGIHDARDPTSYGAGYAAAVTFPGLTPGAVPTVAAGAALCDHLLSDAVVNEVGTPVDGGDFRAGCTQALRDATE